jgi:hypothetical protein
LAREDVAAALTSADDERSTSKLATNESESSPVIAMDVQVASIPSEVSQTPLKRKADGEIQPEYESTADFTQFLHEWNGSMIVEPEKSQQQLESESNPQVPQPVAHPVVVPRVPKNPKILAVEDWVRSLWFAYFVFVFCFFSF